MEEDIIVALIIVIIKIGQIVVMAILADVLLDIIKHM